MRIINCLLILLIIVAAANAQQSAEPTSKLQTSNKVYVIGNVDKPDAISFQESMSLLQAIRLAGGTMSSERKSRARITRRISNCRSTIEIIDLRDILGNRVEDIKLQSDDVVEVQMRKGKTKWTLGCEKAIPTIPTIPMNRILIPIP